MNAGIIYPDRNEEIVDVCQRLQDLKCELINKVTETGRQSYVSLEAEAHKLLKVAEDQLVTFSKDLAEGFTPEKRGVYLQQLEVVKKLKLTLGITF